MNQNDLKHQIARLKKRQREYEKASRSKRVDPLDRNRYEGIATASRWAVEDLQTYLTKS